MRERSSTQGELGAKARECPPSVLPTAAAPVHLSPPAILVVCARSVHSQGSLLLFPCVAFGSLGLLVCLFGCSHRWSWSERPSLSFNPFSPIPLHVRGGEVLEVFPVGVSPVGDFLVGVSPVAGSEKVRVASKRLPRLVGEGIFTRSVFSTNPVGI